MRKLTAVENAVEQTKRHETKAKKDFYAERRVRHGKTAKDHKSGSWANRLKNRDERDAWCNNRNSTNKNHPSGIK